MRRVEVCNKVTVEDIQFFEQFLDGTICAILGDGKV